MAARPGHRSRLVIQILEFNPRHDLLRSSAHVSAEHFYKLSAGHFREAFTSGVEISTEREFFEGHQHDLDAAKSLDLLAWLQAHAANATVQDVAILEELPALPSRDGFRPVLDLLGRDRKADVSGHLWLLS